MKSDNQNPNAAGVSGNPRETAPTSTDLDDGQVKIVPIILSGGSGTRLWPLSRSMRPKQFINLVGDESLFKETINRVRTLQNALPSMVVCNHEHRFMVTEQLQELGAAHSGILLEPEGRNTAPAIAAAAIKLSQTPGMENALMLVLSADHLIDNPEQFHRCVATGVESAKAGRLVTFGVVPTRPATEFGYLRRAAPTPESQGVFEVLQYIEKPNIETATEFAESGEYLWNSGMFLFDSKTFLDELKTQSPDMVTNVTQAVAEAEEDLGFVRLEDHAYARCQNISVDYAVMEKSKRVSVVPLDAGWSDIGSWASLWEVQEKDHSGNVTKGDVWLEAVANSYIYSENRMVSAIGVKDLVIVETHDCVLVADKNSSQIIKTIVSRLKSAQRSEAELHRKAFRPWGNYDCLDNGDRFQVKRIMVKPGQCTSMQRHFHRSEHWIVVSGTAEVTCGDKTFFLSENESTFIPLGEQHRLKNPGKVVLELIEVQSGAYLGEDDIERIDDEYGRA